MNWNGFETLGSFVEERIKEFDQISPERRSALANLAGDVQGQLSAKGNSDLVFICTHNSRRSHMSQLWAQVAAWYFGVEGIHCFSGGTEATAFHPNAVKALKEASFGIKKKITGSNPVYTTSYPGVNKDDRVFSKKYTDPPNPAKGFIAVMTCNDADEACPVVFGAMQRHSIQYEDPKKADGSPLEKETYAERSRQISREMLFLFSKV
jgi:hypothetical protein